MNPEAKWSDWFNLFIGAWLILLPMLALGELSAAAAINSYSCGVIIAIVSLIALARPSKWEEWINLVVGMWVFIAPFLLGYWDLEYPAWNHIFSGALVAGFALWALVRRQQMARAY